MTATDAFSTARPALRPDVVLGPGLIEGARTVHHLKDPRTGWFFRVGPREFFLLSRLDGRRTLDEIADAYREHFGRSLGDAHWNQLLGLLGRRRLLAGTDDPAELERLAAAARKDARTQRRLLSARLPLVDPDDLFTRLDRPLRFLFTPAFVVPAAVAILGLLAAVIARGPVLLTQVHAATSTPVLVVVAVAVIWLTIAVHECAHGLTCKHYGGSAPEIGILWRFPILAPYCKADDVVLFPRRRYRVYTAFAGIFSGLVAILPFGAVWLLAAPDGVAGRLCALVVLAGFGTAFGNLIPFLQLDGYFMLNHALGMSNLRTESYRFWGLLLGRLIGRPAPLAAYRPWLRAAYVTYGLLSVLYGLYLAVRFGVAAGFWLVARVGPSWAAAVGVAVVVAGTVAVVVTRRRRRTGAGPASGGPGTAAVFAPAARSGGARTDLAPPG